MDVFSTWELASATWLLALIGLCFYFKAVREAALEVIKVIFRARLRQWALLMVAYVILVCFTLKQIGLWELSDFKLSLLWLTTAAFLMTYRTANEQPDPRELIRSIFEQGLSLAVLLEFFVGWAQVPFLLAFILVPVATFLNFMAEPSATDEKQAAIVRQFATKALAVIGLGLCLYAVIYTIVHWNEFWRMETAREFLLPVLLNLLFLPFLWILLTYMAYELAHLRLRFIAPAQSRPKRVMVRLFWEFGIRYNEVKHWSLYCIKKPPSDNKSLVQSFSSSRDTRYDHDTNPSY